MAINGAPGNPKYANALSAILPGGIRRGSSVPTDLLPHELAEMVPSMSEGDYASLRDDIKANGLLEPITLYKGAILDGRHRYRACRELGIDAIATTYDGENPAAYVVAKNLHRRHLTRAQRAAIGLRLLPHFEEEARKRLASSGFAYCQTAVGKYARTKRDADRPKKEGESSWQAAQAVGISRNSLLRAKRIQEQSPELYKKVMDGEMSIFAADEQVRTDGRSRKGSRQRDITKPYVVTNQKAEQNANAAKRRMQKVIAELSGYAEGLKTFDLPRAMALATEGDIKWWTEVLSDTIRTLRNLRAALQKEE